MNLLMPANIRAYFFFDGEKMDGLTRADKAAKVKEAIRNIMRASRAFRRPQEDLNIGCRRVSPWD